MNDNKKEKKNIDDYFSVIFRNKNEIFHHKAVNKILYYENDTNLFFTGGCDSIIKLWINNKQSELTLLSNLEFHSNWISSLAFDKSKNLLFSSSNDQTICFWDLNILFKNIKNNLTTLFPQLKYSYYHSDYITSIKFNKYNDLLYSCGLDGKIYSIDINKKDSKEEILSKESSIYSIDLCENENLLSAALYEENQIIIIDTKSNKEICKLHGHNDIIKNIKISPDGKNLISVSSDKTIKFWDISKKKFIYNLEYHNSSIHSLFINNDFDKMITGSIDGKIYINDFQIGNYALFDEIDDCILDIQMNESENQIITSSRNGKLYIYDLYEKEKSYINYNLDNSIGKIPLIEEENRKVCEISQNEISEYKLMNNKIYTIIKYKNKNIDGGIYNLLKMKFIKDSKNSSYKSLVKKLNEIDNKNLESWCNLDIHTGCLKMTLFENKCFLNNISKLDLNYIENIIKKNFAINSNTKLYFDENKVIKIPIQNGKKDKNSELKKQSSLSSLEKMEKKNKNIIPKTFVKQNEEKIFKTFGHFIFKNINTSLFIEKLLNFTKLLFENYSEEKVKNDYFEFFEKNDDNDIDNLFINVSIKNTVYSFYLNNDNEMGFPDFCIKGYNELTKNVFKCVNFEPFTNNISYNLYIIYEEVNQFLKNQKKKSKMVIDNGNSFKKLFSMLEKNLDKNKIKKQILNELSINNFTNKEISYIKNKYIEDESNLIKSFYFKDEKDIIIKRKECEDKIIIHIIGILNKGSFDSYTLKLCYKDIKSVINEFGIF